MEDMRRVIYMHDEKCDANKMNMHMLGFWRLHLVCVCTKVRSAKASVGIPGETAKSNGKL